MNKNKNILSLSMDPEMQEFIDKCAEKKGVSRSKLMRDLVDKYLVADDSVIPVILKIPGTLKGNEEGLKKWMDARAAAIVKALSAQ
jgi:hypothetical protein